MKYHFHKTYHEHEVFVHYFTFTIHQAGQFESANGYIFDIPDLGCPINLIPF